jgi:hypothetical protein
VELEVVMEKEGAAGALGAKAVVWAETLELTLPLPRTFVAKTTKQ